jgi:hypothetical protein
MASRSFIMPLQESHKTHPNDLGRDSMNNVKRKFDASTVAIMWQAMNEVAADRRFLIRQSVTPLEVAEHILDRCISLANNADDLTKRRLLDLANKYEARLEGQSLAPERFTSLAATNSEMTATSDKTA